MVSKPPSLAPAAVGAVLALLGILLYCSRSPVDLAGPAVLALGCSAMAYWLGAGLISETIAIGRGERVGMSLVAIVGAVGVAAFVIGGAGFVERTFNDDDYRYRHGVEVAATAVGANCTPGTGSEPEPTCPATWTLHGKQYQGTLHLTSSDYTTTGGPFQTTAYALGDQASAPSTVNTSSTAADWGAIPPWIGLVGLGLAVAAIAALAILVN
jgi:hypothetical protein